MKKLIVLLKTLPKILPILIAFATSSLNASVPPPPQVHRLAPSHWYVGFKDTSLEIIVYAENMDLYEISMEPAEGVIFRGKSNSGNRHIAYLNLTISNKAKPVILVFNAKASIRRPRYVKGFKFNYELKTRTAWNNLSLNEKDILYRIIVDRFSSGDDGNDNVAISSRIKADRNDPQARHGGDIKGVINRADYIKGLGVSTVWLNPVQVNDHSYYSQTGHYVSDHYNVDPRVGNNELFLKLCMELHKRNLKVIMDVNPNDFSNNHWLYQNFDTGWFNKWDTFMFPDFTSYSINDPYYSPGERSRTITGWTDRFSPDVNQNNPHMRRYLDQLFLWWLEYSGINGVCITRVALFSHEYLEHIIKKIQSEFPDAAIITDTRTNSVAAQASMVKNNIHHFEDNLLRSIPDYHLHAVYRDLLWPQQNLTASLSALYTALSDDILYENPGMNLTFIDNSTEKRAIDWAESNMERWKLTCAILLTQRGIPIIYYGTEILLSSNYMGPQPAQIDFPGGWKSDSKNKFMAPGRTPAEQEAYDYLVKLIQVRNANPVLTTGKLMQYPVENGIYVYFRYDEKNSIMVVTNSGSDTQTLDLKRFAERFNGFNSASEVMNKSVILLSSPLEIPGSRTLIFKLF